MAFQLQTLSSSEGRIPAESAPQQLRTNSIEETLRCDMAHLPIVLGRNSPDLGPDAVARGYRLGIERAFFHRLQVFVELFDF